MRTESDSSEDLVSEKGKKKPAFKRSLSGWTRWLHIYLSMFSFAALLFFAITGITLNHPSWLSSQEHISRKGQLNPSWVKGKDSILPARQTIADYLRRQEGLQGYLADVLPDEWQVTLSFKGPGYAADVFINRETGAYELDISRTGWTGILNDLHKGRDAGPVWSGLIDFSAVLLILVSLSGLLLLLFLRKKRVSGLVLLLLGLLAGWLTALYWVP